MEWMIVEQSIEEELQLEKTCREIRRCDDLESLVALCVAMTRQQWHQSKLLKQAVNHIAHLDSLEEQSAA